MENLLSNRNNLPRRLAPALMLSIGLNLLIIWFIAKLIPHNIESHHRSKAIQITFGNQLRNQQIASAKAIKPILSNQAESHSSTHSQKQPEPLTQKNRIKQQIKSDSPHSVTTAKILSSASSITHDIATEGPNDTKKDETSVSAILNKALNPHREAPGVSNLADGTIRVVTKQGYTYCIKPMDDGKINGPEDDIRVSVYCN
ncbi:MAG: hypothetical protein P8179_17300 [Candidatus Thiodiazotropha sp.]|jgi:hypothetical protein